VEILREGPIGREELARVAGVPVQAAGDSQK
jgi:hypothetical protein